MHEQLLRLEGLSPGVLLKGGHLAGDESVDLLRVDGGTHRFTSPRVRTRNTHGTGCTLSSAVAVLRPRTDTWADAVRSSREYLSGAIAAADSRDIGRGNGPVHHFHQVWQDQVTRR